MKPYSHKNWFIRWAMYIRDIATLTAITLALALAMTGIVELLEALGL